MKKTISNFKGILPRFDIGNMPVGYARTAENINLFDGKLKGSFDDEEVAGSVTGQFLHKYNGNFYSGDGYGLTLVQDSAELFIYSKPGFPLQIELNGDTDNLGIEKPEISNINVVTGAEGLGAGSYRYVIVWERQLDGGAYVDISEPSDIEEKTLTADTEIPIIHRGTPPSSFVTHFRIYRTTSFGSVFYLVGREVIGVTNFNDTEKDDDITSNEILPSYYLSYSLSQAGTNIFWSAPAVEFDGMASNHFNTILFAWKDDVWYASEPGQPQAWPIEYSQSVGAKILNIVAMESYAAILTEEGAVYRIDYNDPILMKAIKTRGSHPCLSTRGWAETPFGLCFASDSGIAVFNGNETKIAFYYGFDEYFYSQLNLSLSVMAYQDEKIYLFKTGSFGEAIVFDIRDFSKPNFFTLKHEGDIFSAYVEPNTGEIYGGIGLLGHPGSVFKLGSKTDCQSRKEFTWFSGKMEIPGKNFNFINKFVVKGRGTIKITVYVDNDPYTDTEVASKEMDLDDSFIYTRTLLIPDGVSGEHFSIKIEGINKQYTPEIGAPFLICPHVDEVAFEVF